ncbi:MAG: hypothetical protein RBS39_02340 [Phycisphaerales bacterium]|jgi:hypothetical protein|nr:hypothetical protein [Phycisphaerales bacterium]
MDSHDPHGAEAPNQIAQLERLAEAKFGFAFATAAYAFMGIAVGFKLAHDWWFSFITVAVAILAGGFALGASIPNAFVRAAYEKGRPLCIRCRRELDASVSPVQCPECGLRQPGATLDPMVASLAFGSRPLRQLLEQHGEPASHAIAQAVAEVKMPSTRAHIWTLIGVTLFVAFAFIVFQLTTEIGVDDESAMPRTIATMIVFGLLPFLGVGWIIWRTPRAFASRAARHARAALTAPGSA